MQSLVDNIQYVFENPIKKIDWIQIQDMFKKLLEKKIEYDEDEIHYIMEKLKFPKFVDPAEFFVLADELRLNFVFTKSMENHIPEFEEDNPKLVACLKTILFNLGIGSHLSYPTDYWLVMAQFEKIIKSRIKYDIDEIRNWLEFNQKKTTCEDGVIENIIKIAEFMQLYLTKPQGYSA